MTTATPSATSPVVRTMISASGPKVLLAGLLCGLAFAGCSVDSPERDNFDYSFLDEVESQDPELSLVAEPVTASIQVEFLDGQGVYADEVAKLDGVRLEILGVDALMNQDDGDTWRTIRSDALDIDLLDVKDGDARTIARGPMPEGDFSALRLRLGDRFVEEEGQKVDLDLPGDVLLIEGDYELFNSERTTLIVTFGALRGMARTDDGQAWQTTPNVSVVVRSADE